ncbi:hypothetical protein F5148DRAFT_1295414 [Russula earlei]|uniref:Uncharacterized protein n=1 Tax=Russula earlei TaxID=71964 RepID=A0ACC0TRV3_9AGAM|nr:hypothetical protein F5148DRAFT_1295414 [Russula earlei]
MKLKVLLVVFVGCIATVVATAQNKLTVDKVYSAQLKNSGSIIGDGQVKGYFLFYQSDKVDKKTNEYTLSILDQNLNKVKEIKFTDSKDVQLMEAAYNGNALSFLFHNKKEKIFESRVYGFDGKLKFTYTKELDKKSEEYLKQLELMRGDNEDATNDEVFSVADKGFATIIPLRDGKLHTYELEYYSSESRKQWAFNPNDEEHWASAVFLGATDSIIVLEVSKKDRAMSGKTTASIIGLNYETKKKVFELDGSKDKFNFVPQYCTKLENSSNLLFMGSYFSKTDDIVRDFSQGLAIYIISPTGQVVSSTYNSWAKDIGKYVNLNEKGKIDDIGYLFFHNIIQSSNGKLFAVGEGYKRVADAAGIAVNALSMLGGRVNGGGNTKIKVTDMVILQFTPDYKIAGATIQQKNSNSFHTMYADLNSQHALALYVKALGGFDYAFTTADKEVNSFAICYNDYERSSDYKGETFHTMRYNGTKFSNDKLELASKASSLKVFPAKPGSVMIMEYFKKEKRLNLRLEKVN